METIQMIQTDKLHPHPQNPRLQVGDVTELAESIRRNGVMQNLTVVPRLGGADGDYIVVIGHRRLAAAKLAGLAELPCTVVDMDKKTQIATMLLENMQRRDLNVYEEAAGMQMMLDLGDDVADVAEQTGLSQSTVRRRVRLLHELGDEGLRAAAGKQIDIVDMERIAELEDPRMQERALEDAGTKDFEWTMNNLMRAQERAHEWAELKAYADGFATRVQEALPRHKFVKAICSPDDPGFEPCPQREYVYTVPSTASPLIYVYTVLSDTELARVRADAKNEREASDARETAERGRTDRLKELAETARECRENFVKNISASAAYPEKAMEFAVRMMLIMTRHCMGGTLLVRFACDDEDELYRMMRGSRSFAARILINAAYLAAAKGPYTVDHDYIDYNGGYAENERLDEVYAALCELGYELSAEEGRLADGTHELYSGG